MMILYTFGYWLVGLVSWSFGRRARAYGARFNAAGKSAERLAHELNRRPGNSNTPDPYVAAKGYYELGKQVDSRDKLELRYLKWLGRANGASKLRERLGGWKGKYVPYFVGAVDVAIVAVVLHLTGVVDVPAVQAATAVVAQG